MTEPMTEPTQISNESSDAPAGAYTIDKTLASGELTPLQAKQFGTVLGVYLPTVLNILGVIMYLRLGWVVGNAGLGGAVLIILLAYAITGLTAFSISSIVTNIRLGSGGVFSIVSQSLGLEVGGTVGIQFFLAQTFATSMYIYGFMEAWRYLFPSHPGYAVVIGVFLVMVSVSYLSTSLAFRLQAVVMLGTLTALGSMLMGLWHLPEVQRPEVFGTFKQGSFWLMFAVFFPAATDVMVGTTMSGNLKRPRWSIPAGTLGAWGTTLLVYLGLAAWYGFSATPDELLSRYLIAAERSYWGLGVSIGVLAACFNAGLSSLTVAPRVLQSLGEHKILSFISFVADLNNGEPRKALLVSAALVMLWLTAGDLNVLAVFVTICFLITYFTINFLLAIEQQLKLVSFRPTFRLPKWVPLAGSFACLVAILVISPFWGLITILASVAIYTWLSKRGLESPWETIHGGVFVSIVNWAAKKVVNSNGKAGPRAWKPDLLVPVERRTQLDGYYRLLIALVKPQGSIQAMALMKNRDIVPLLGLSQSIEDFRKEKVYASASFVQANDFKVGMETSVDVLKGTLSAPNVLFIDIKHRSQDELQHTLDLAHKNDTGVVFYAAHDEAILGREQYVNLWVRDQSPNWQLSLNLTNLDLSLLMSYQLLMNWQAELNVLTVVQNPEHAATAQHYLQDLMQAARIPKRYKILVKSGNFRDQLSKSPRADVNIFGIPPQVNKELLQNLVNATRTTCLFIKDSGQESALA